MQFVVLYVCTHVYMIYICNSPKKCIEHLFVKYFDTLPHSSQQFKLLSPFYRGRKEA